MQTNVQIDTKALRHSPEHGKGGKGGNRYTAERDAGGPGVVYGKLVGVVSFGAPNCGAPDAPTVFTKLGFYTDWIEGIIEMKVPTAKKTTTERTTREKIYKESFRMSTKTHFKIAPVTKRDAERAPVPSEDALRNLDENKLFKEFVKTMFGSEEAKEYLDQYDSDTDIETQEKVRPKDITRSFTVKPIAQTTTEGNIEGLGSGDLEVPQDVQKGSVKMVTIIEDFEDPVVKSEEDTTRYATMPMIKKMDVRDLVEQNIAKLINDIDIQELLESAIGKSSGDKAIRPKKPKITKNKIIREERKSNKNIIKPKEIKHNADKIKPIDVISSNENIKSIEIKLTTDKIKPKQIKLIIDKGKPIDDISYIHKIEPKEIERKGDEIEPEETQHNKGINKPNKQTSTEDSETESTVESALESVEESETSDDYTDDRDDESDDDNNYVGHHSGDPSHGRVDKKAQAKEVTFRQNNTSAGDLFSHKNLLNLIHEVLAEVVENATSKQNDTKGIPSH